jgi:hypothetical protein
VANFLEFESTRLPQRKQTQAFSPQRFTFVYQRLVCGNPFRAIKIDGIPTIGKHVMTLAAQNPKSQTRPTTSRATAPGTQIGAEEFCGLLLSRRRMIRLDQSETGLRGLRDLDSGELFYTEERRLTDA